jgi:hypothetical protein
MEEGMLLFSPFKPARKRRFARVIFPPQNFWAIELFILSPFPSARLRENRFIGQSTLTQQCIYNAHFA